MRQFQLVTTYFFILYGCNTATENHVVAHDKLKSTEQVTGNSFFEYDSVDYYFNEFNESEIGDLFDNQYKSEIDSFKMGIILGDIPKDISDLSFINTLKKNGYKKSIIENSEFKNIDSIFLEKTSNENSVRNCIYVYRDILIFKKLNKVVGIAKVCFGCKANQIIGTKANTENFGRDGDYERLETILGNLRKSL